MSETIRTISKAEALAIHDASLARFGGLPGVRDEGLLDSAVRQPSQSFGGQELYPTLDEKAARLAYGLIKNHAFLDGNKRVGTACLGAMLRLNGREFRLGAAELLATMMGVADGSVSCEELAAWVLAQA
ncbi:MAG: type II toxin-antitoxin system death-on-curing family toxin [Atopobiaceae bacterium]|nr:type II toxin-antitoxin system death-on-curing family toxin [Atopobiaceae bacterium]